MGLKMLHERAVHTLTHWDWTEPVAVRLYAPPAHLSRLQFPTIWRLSQKLSQREAQCHLSAVNSLQTAGD